jgi:prepilin-type N-terminal cleavage/methylation domain-containing protein
MRRNEKGFTLMELMVVIVIVAILAAVAVPLYINYVKDALRTEAKGAIGAVITAEQTYYQLNPDGGPQSYTVDTFVPNPGATPGSQILNCDLTEALNNWQIAVTAADANGFTVQATGIADRPTEGLVVTYAYTRTGTSAWTEQ